VARCAGKVGEQGSAQYRSPLPVRTLVLHLRLHGALALIIVLVAWLIEVLVGAPTENSIAVAAATRRG
jgi:hypothetical protein